MSIGFAKASQARGSAGAEVANQATIEWQRILLYIPKAIGGREGMIDTPGFYLAPDGKTDHLSELAATIKAFQQPIGDKPDEHPLCRFPRRHAWVAKYRPDLNIAVRPNCKIYQEWLANLGVDGVSLVFSSNYLNNPSSMYGHTFLRLHRRNNIAHQESSPLLDHAVNFAANVTTDTPVLYAIYGLFGRFFGTFSLMPYYLKVQEYNNAESRDLWEYPMRLSQQDIEALLATLWEAGPHGIRYWYFDENCSYVLLGILAAAQPRYDAIDTFGNIVTPKDTVLALAANGAIGEPKRRLSALGRFQTRLQYLNSDESDLLREQIETENLLPTITSLEPKSQLAVLDAIIEWIAYDESLAGSEKPTKHRDLWEQVLASRASIASPSPPIASPTNINTRPDIGHPSQRIATGIRMQRHGRASLSLGYRFSLHDSLSPPTGYSNDQEITMGDFYLSIRDKGDNSWSALPEKATIIRILSIPTADRLTGGKAWTLSFGSERYYRSSFHPNSPESWLTHKLEGGLGAAIAKTSAARIFAIPIATLGRIDWRSNNLDVGLGIRSGVTLDISQNLRMTAQLDGEHLINNRNYFVRSSVTASLDLSDLHEIRLQVIDPGTSLSAATTQWLRYF